MRRSTLAVLAVGLLPMAAFAQAVSPPPSDNEDIVVEAGRERAETFTRSMGRAQVGGQYPRWDDPLCVRMIGMTGEAARLFEERIRTVAREVGAPVAEAGCDTNLTVGFTTNGQAVARRLYQRRSTLFSERPRSQRERFVEGGDAVRWWPLTAIVGYTRRGSGGSGAEGGIAIDGETHSSINVPTFDNRIPSLITVPSMAIMAGMTVIIDSRRTEGVNLMALADHVAMIALTGVPMPTGEQEAPGDSVMALFSPPPYNRTGGLSEADRAYLTQLYRQPANRRANDQRGALRGAVREALVVADDGDNAPGP